MNNPLISVTLLPVELKNRNDGQGFKWHRSDAERKSIERKLSAYGFERQPLRFPARIMITRILGPGQKLWDEDSIGRGNAKQLIDSLVALGWFHDDKPKHLTKVDYGQNKGFRAYGPSTLIEVYQTDERQDRDISEEMEMARVKIK